MEYSFKKDTNGKTKYRITVSKTQIHTTPEMLHHLGYSKTLNIYYDQKNKAIKFGEGDDRRISYTSGRPNNPHISSTLGKYKMPLGEYHWSDEEQVFLYTPTQELQSLRDKENK